MDDGEETSTSSSEHRMAIGIALGASVGAVLPLLLDNWGMVGVGIALGAALGAIPPGRNGAAGDAPRPQD